MSLSFPVNSRIRNLGPRLLRRTRLGQYVNSTCVVEVGGQAFSVPIRGARGWAHLQRSEPWLLRTMRALVALKSGAFLDVGVHLGQTLLKYAAVSPIIDYYGFEPNVRAVTYVEDLIAANGLAGARLIPIGLSNRAGMVPLYVRSSVTSMATIIPGQFGPDFHDFERMVPVLPGDDVVKELEIPDIAILKIDVEGSELQVLEGLRGTIAHHRPLIFCEVLPPRKDRPESLDDRTQRRAEVDRFIHALDYRPFQLPRDRAPYELSDILQSDDPVLRDYLFVPAEHVEQVGARLTPGDAR